MSRAPPPGDHGILRAARLVSADRATWLSLPAQWPWAAWVCTHHCPKAVETTDQERFVVGRPFERPPRITGDVTFAEQFGLALPGP